MCRLNIRKAAEPLDFIRKVAEPIEDAFARSWPVALVCGIEFGRGAPARVQTGPGRLASRTDKDGNLAPYEADDPEVIGKLFGIDYR